MCVLFFVLTKPKKTTEISQFQHDPGLHLSNSKRESESAYPAYPAYAVSSLIRFPSICLHLCPGVALSTSSCIKTLNLLTSSIYLDLSTSTTLSIYLSIYPSIHSFIYLTISGSFYPSIRYFFYLIVSVSLSLSLYLLYLSFYFTMTIISTSSTAQGGGGSFKNRKPIGEVGCCESGMAERSH